MWVHIRDESTKCRYGGRGGYVGKLRIFAFGVSNVQESIMQTRQKVSGTNLKVGLR